MTEEREDKNRMMKEPSAVHSEPQPAGAPIKNPRRNRRLSLAPEGVDRQFWPLWRAHVLAGIGMMTGYSLGLPVIFDSHRKDS